MPDDLKPGDEIVFTVTGEKRPPKNGEWYLYHTDGWEAVHAYGDHSGKYNYPILARTVRRAGERPGYFDARFEKIEAAIAELKAKREPERESPYVIAERIVSDWANERGSYPGLTLRIAAAIRAERERKP